MKSYDVIVLGVGAMGAASCYHAAKRGVRVLGLEQFTLGHGFGSSHGETRIIRKAYFEHSDYIPLLARAYELWQTLESETRDRLLVKCGLILFGNARSSAICKGTLESARKYRIPVETLTAAEARARFPDYRPADEDTAIFEPGAGYLMCERALIAHASMARKLGGEILESEVVRRIESDLRGIRIVTDRDTYHAAKLIITGGAWSRALIQDLKLDLKLQRLIQYWFRVSFDQAHGAPCFAFHRSDDFYYGFPTLDGQTVKIAAHFAREPLTDPSERDIASPPLAQLEAMRGFIRECLPHVSDELVHFKPCIYTMTPDEHFIVDAHPRNPNVVFAAGFSGHGFKFASVMGEILADLALDGATEQPIDFLRVREKVTIN